MTHHEQTDFTNLFHDLGVKRSAMSIITGRCGSTLVGELCRALRFGDGVETLNSLGDGEISKYDGQRITQIMRPAVVDGIFYHQTTYHRWKKLSEFIAPAQLGLDVTLIFRRNFIAQAISYVNAIETGKWHSNQLAAAPTPMTAAERVTRGIAFIEQILAEESRLTKAFPKAPIFYYEDIVTSPLETMHRFLSFYNHNAPLCRIAEELNSRNMTEKLVRNGYSEQYEQLFNAYPRSAETLWSRFNA